LPGSFSRTMNSPKSTSRLYIDSTSSRIWTQSRCLRKSFSKTASLICCLDLRGREGDEAWIING
jgi:hypothetical protein